MDRKHRILLIDDSEITIEGLRNSLVKKYEVKTAFNGLDALKIFKENECQFDLIITDMVMPFISGAGLIFILREKAPHIPVIAMTGWGQHPAKLAEESKVDMVLMKPFGIEELESSISRFLTPHTA